VSFDELVEHLHAVAQGAGEDWRRTILETRIDEPEKFLEWARHHRRWQFAVAEAAEEVCAKPREAAAFVAMKIVEELLEG
jgi:hypothetical protein